jgi:hypothetical protein
MFNRNWFSDKFAEWVVTEILGIVGGAMLTFKTSPINLGSSSVIWALRRNPIDAAIDGVWGHPEFRYTPWIEKQRLDKDSRLVGVSGISK